jgi:H+/Cl- antiporter ClcA
MRPLFSFYSSNSTNAYDKYCEHFCQIKKFFCQLISKLLTVIYQVASFWSTLLTWRTFFTCMVAVMAGELFLEIQSGVYQTNGLMIFNVGSTELAYRVSELIPFAIIGVIGGLLGSAFSALHLAAVKMRAAKINKKRSWRVLEVAAITLVLSTLQFSIPFAFHCKYGISTFIIIAIFLNHTLILEIFQRVV